MRPQEEEEEAPSRLQSPLGDAPSATRLTFMGKFEAAAHTLGRSSTASGHGRSSTASGRGRASTASGRGTNGHRRSNQVAAPARKSTRQILDEHRKSAADVEISEVLEEGMAGDDWTWQRKLVGRVVSSTVYSIVVSLVIVYNMYIIVLDTDLRQGQSTGGLAYFRAAQWTMLFFYITDLVSRLYVLRCTFFLSPMNIFDFCIIVMDIALEVIPPEVAKDLPSLMVLRVLRIGRIVRVLRSFTACRELYLMMQGLASAMRAIFFAIVLIFLMFTIFSIMAVDSVHQDNIQLFESGYYGDCEWCGRAFSSVMMSNLTFFKHIVAGDSWGLLSVPLIENDPWKAAPILLAASCTVQLGLLNLIVAIIVDRAAGAREDDQELQHTLKEEELQASYARLQELFRLMDSDGSASLDLEELQESYDESEAFRNILNLMDITKDDLETVFDILDANHDGFVAYEEFVTQLHYVKFMNSHSLLVFIRYHCESLCSKVSGIEEILLELKAVWNQESVTEDKKAQSQSSSNGVWVPLPADLSSAISLGVDPESVHGASPSLAQSEIEGESSTSMLAQADSNPHSCAVTPAVATSKHVNEGFALHISDALQQIRDQLVALATSQQLLLQRANSKNLTVAAGFPTTSQDLSVDVAAPSLRRSADESTSKAFSLRGEELRPLTETLADAPTMFPPPSKTPPSANAQNLLSRHLGSQMRMRPGSSRRQVPLHTTEEGAAATAAVAKSEWRAHIRPQSPAGRSVLAHDEVADTCTDETTRRLIGRPAAECPDPEAMDTLFQVCDPEQL